MNNMDRASFSQVQTGAIDHNVLFLPSIFNETLELLMQSHDYFNHFGPSDQFEHAAHQLVYSSEMSRITMRLTSIMAWIMVRKAVHAGKITEVDAYENYRLDAKDICLHQQAEMAAILPHYMVYLLDKTHRLYSRVVRLEDMVFADQSENEQPTVQ